MGFLKWFKSFIVVQLLLFYVFVMSGLIVNLLQLISVVIWPFNKSLYRKINKGLAYIFWSSKIKQFKLLILDDNKY
jgi:lysophosphatidic acid acyltransferase / lysophosphatidylinositol acyltransferase